jgi:hypothetical protein
MELKLGSVVRLRASYAAHLAQRPWLRTTMARAFSLSARLTEECVKTSSVDTVPAGAGLFSTPAPELPEPLPEPPPLPPSALKSLMRESVVSLRGTATSCSAAVRRRQRTRANKPRIKWRVADFNAVGLSGIRCILSEDSPKAPPCPSEGRQVLGHCVFIPLGGERCGARHGPVVRRRSNALGMLPAAGCVKSELFRTHTFTRTTRRCIRRRNRTAVQSLGEAL